MSFLVTVAVIFILLAAAALIWWGVSRLTLPEPVKTVVLVVFGLICLFFIYHFVMAGGLNLRT